MCMDFCSNVEVVQLCGGLSFSIVDGYHQQCGGLSFSIVEGVHKCGGLSFSNVEGYHQLCGEGYLSVMWRNKQKLYCNHSDLCFERDSGLRRDGEKLTKKHIDVQTYF